MAAFPDFLKKGWTDFKGLTPLQQMVYVMVMVGIVSGLVVAVSNLTLHVEPVAPTSPELQRPTSR